MVELNLSQKHFLFSPLPYPTHTFGTEKHDEQEYALEMHQY